MAAAGRASAGSAKGSRLCGFAVWTPKGFDWVHRRFIRDRVEGTKWFWRKAFENRYVLDKVPDFYDRLKSSYDPRFFEQEVLGEYLNVQAGVVYRGFNRARNVRRWKLIHGCRYFGRWISTWTR